MLVGRLPSVGPCPGQAGRRVGAPGNAPAGEEQRLTEKLRCKEYQIDQLKEESCEQSARRSSVALCCCCIIRGSGGIRYDEAAMHLHVTRYTLHITHPASSQPSPHVVVVTRGEGSRVRGYLDGEGGN